MGDPALTAESRPFSPSARGYRSRQLAAVALYRVRGRCAHSCRRDHRQGIRAENPQATAAEIDAEKRKLGDAPLVIASSVSPSLIRRCRRGRQELSAGASAMEHRHRGDRAWLRRVLADRRFAFRFASTRRPRIEGGQKLAGFVSHRHAVETQRDRPRPALSDIVTRFEKLRLKRHCRAQYSASRGGRKTFLRYR